MSYNPNPTRVWSRVQDRCTYIDSSNNAAYQNVYVPLTRKTVTLGQAIYQDKLISKGNILQYKKNSSNLTKKQKYTQICKGMWTNRTKSYATQSQTYTNPNTSNLLQVNYNSVPSTGTTYINGPYKYNIPSPYGCVSTIIKDGGSLLCNTVANPCTNEVIETTKVLQCYPTSCSDVPGPEQLLCWDSQLNTWYPRQRYTMPTSGTGWPEGYKGFVSAEKPPTPVLTLVSSTSNSVTLSWTVTNDDCIPISSYNIYVNGQIYTTVSYTTTTITINNLCETSTFDVTSVSNTTESDKSNTVVININQVSPIITSITTCYKQATISWVDTTPNIIQYNINQTGYTSQTYSNVTSPYIINGLINGQTYYFTVSAVSNCGTLQSETSTIVMPSTSTYFIVVGGSGIVSGSNYIVTFNATGTLTYNTVCNISVNVSTILVGGGGGGAGGGSNNYGGGGGGGGSVVSQTILFQNNGDVSNITAIGTGGTGGNWSFSGTNGGDTQINFNSINFFTAIHGSGGTINAGGAGGGGNGGNGATIIGTNGLSGGAGISGYSGGGGGASYPNNINNGSGGGCGVNGRGGGAGIYNSSSVPNGANAATYGSGGGGGVGAYNKGNGGRGYQGVAIFTIPN